MANIEEIKTAIVDREEELRQQFEQDHIIERERFAEISKFISKDTALIITGVRRCGKSICAFMLGKDQKYAYVNFEDERLQMEVKELNKVMEAIYSLKGEVDFIIFDEIQNVLGWEQFVARLITNKKIVITGSNARLLSRELATFLTGRHLDFTLFPFSFREFLVYNRCTPNLNLTKDIAQAKNYFEKYLEEGGFPLRYKIGKMFLVETYKDILERDIVQRHGIRHVKVFKEIAKYLISQTSSEMSYNQISNIFKIKSVHTVKNYISYLQQAYLLFVLERFSFKLKEQVLAPKKVYAIDTGLVKAVGFTFMDNRGKLMENVVAVELFRIFSSRPEYELYYWKDHQQREVDFIIKKGQKIKQLIQVCYDLSNINTKEREIKALLRASEDLRCQKALVITFDFEQEEECESLLIQYIPLWRWLLQKGDEW